MMTSYSWGLLICVIPSVLAGITSSPGLQRKNRGENCVFEWHLTGNIPSFEVFNQTSGVQTKLNSNANYSDDKTRHVISLFIWNVQLWDAGNYSLSLNTGTTMTIDAGALLFVYDTPTSSTITSNITIPGMEGDSIRLVCNVRSTSLPSSYRPDLYYYWELGNYGTIKNTSSGQPIRQNGEVLTRYNIKENGRVLEIASLQYSDKQNFKCWAQEHGSRYVSNRHSTYISLNLYHRPVILTVNPVSRRVNVDIGRNVSLEVTYAANSPIGDSNVVAVWNFYNQTGVSHNLPPSFSNSPTSRHLYATFNLISEVYYGRYNLTLTNSIGDTKDSFSVVPPGPPDAPTNLRISFVTSGQISLSWNCMWFNGRQQTIFIELKDLENKEVLEIMEQLMSNDCFNQTRNILFQNDILPETDYEMNLWSNNSLGLSNTVMIPVRTPKPFKFLVSDETIAINGSEAVIDFKTQDGNMTLLSITCCVESNGVCVSRNFTVIKSLSQVTMRGIPRSQIYLFDFVAYGENSEGIKYFLAMVKGIRVARHGNLKGSDSKLKTIITLSILLAIAIIALVGSWVFILRLKQLSNENPNSSASKLEESASKKEEPVVRTASTKTATQPQGRALPDPVKARPKAKTPLPLVDDPVEEVQQEMYEPMELRKPDEQETYTALDQPTPNRMKKKNIYM